MKRKWGLFPALWFWGKFGSGRRFQIFVASSTGKKISPAMHRGENLLKFSLLLPRCTVQWVMTHLETESRTLGLCSEVLYWQLLPVSPESLTRSLLLGTISLAIASQLSGAQAVAFSRERELQIRVR